MKSIMCKKIFLHKYVNPNADNKVIASLFRQLNFSGKDSQHSIMIVVSCLYSLVFINFHNSTNSFTHNKDASKSITCLNKFILDYKD